MWPMKYASVIFSKYVYIFHTSGVIWCSLCTRTRIHSILTEILWFRINNISCLKSEKKTHIRTSHSQNTQPTNTTNDKGGKRGFMELRESWLQRIFNSLELTKMMKRESPRLTNTTLALTFVYTLCKLCMCLKRLSKINIYS